MIRAWLFRPGWPLGALLCLYPLWWALGIGEFAFVIFAIPMAWDLRRRHPIRLPPAFGFWLLFLLWNVLSLVMLPLDAPDTIAGGTVGRTLGVMFRLFQFAAVTVIAMYVVNLPAEQVSMRKIMRWLVWLFIVTVIGGLFALVAPHFSFNSPLERLLPQSVRVNTYVQALVHPQLAQVQTVLGFSSPRPAAPWGYTNNWGNNISILLVWFCVYMWRPATGWRRLGLGVTIAITLVPIVYSLNRGVWFGIILSVAYLIYRLAARGDMRALLATALLLPVGVIAFLATPLHGVIDARASHGGSNEVRAFADKAAIHGALHSPILGWGGTRKTIGSGQSIAIGATPKCPNCGNVGIGSTGEFWEIIFSQGLVGIALYFGFFIAAFWALRRDRSISGAAARLIILLAVFYSYFYDSLPAAAGLTMISISLAWREISVPEEQLGRPLPLTAAPTFSPLVSGIR